MATKKTTAKEKVMDTVQNTKEIVKDVVKETKKASTRKEIKTTIYVEYCGKQVQNKDMIAAAKKAWTNAGHKVGDIKTMDLYVKPEEEAVYYVINKTETGRIAF